MSMQQMLMFIHQQQVFQAQMQAQMQQSNYRFEQLLSSQGDKKKKDPPVYEGKFGEDLELWIFATEEYYSSKKQLMLENSSHFVTMISSNLGKTVLNWYRSFSLQCEAENVHKTWELFKVRLRARFRPKDFEYNLRERLFHLKQSGSIHEYVSRFQDLMSQSELEISDMEQRFYFQNGLRPETVGKIKEESPMLLKDVIEIASNFEFAHFVGKPPKSTSAQPSASKSKRFKTAKKPERSSINANRQSDWKKSATCNKCGIKGHISPDCRTGDKPKEANRYVSGSFYAILQVMAKAFKDADHPSEVSIFIDNGCSLNGISEELAQRLGLDVTEDRNEIMEVDLGFGQTVVHPRRTVEMSLEVPGFPVMKTNFQIMPIPEEKDVILGMMWLREQNPEIDWVALQLKPRKEEKPIPLKTPNVRPSRKIAGRRTARLSQQREIFNFYCQNGHFGEHGKTDIISAKQLQRELRKSKNIEAIFVINPHVSEKAERFKNQGWEALRDNPAFETLLKYQDTVFRTELPNSTPPIREGIEHEIQLQPGTKPISVRQWRQSPEQRQVIMDWTKEMVKAGIIRPSTSAFCAPTFCVKKPVGWRIVHDYRQLNQATIMPAIPMPRKEDTFEAMAGSKWFSCMDLLWGYYQVKLREQDIPFTAFSTPDGLFEYLVTPMGLSGSPGTFNRLLQRVFSDLRNVMRIYFDDIYVFTRSDDVSEHVKALDHVLKRCEEQELYIKLTKCQFCVEEIPCLGDFVGRNGVRMDPDKVKIIREWPTPKTKKQMESFLGTTVYVSRFFPDFAQFAGPLHDAIKAKKSREAVILDDRQFACFEELKRRLSSPPVLKLPDFTKPFGIRMDASNFAVGGVLFQKEGGLEYPIAYTGRKMKAAELNYPVREQELLAIMHALRVWRVYLLDRPFLVETDHKSIETILTQKTTNRRVARWFNELAEFQPQFKWIPGESNDVADALSRNPDFEHNAAQVSLSELLDAAQNREIVASVKATTTPLKTLINKRYSSDQRLQDILKKLKNEEVVPKYSSHDELLYYQTKEDEAPRLVIPDDEDLKNRVAYENHDVVTAGHPGYFKTYVAVQKKYYWPRMYKFIKRYVNTCELCQRNKARQMKPPGLLNPLEIPCGRWMDISMDFMVSLPSTNSNFDAIMIIVDRLTKRSMFIPTKTTASAEDTAELFMKHYVKDHGLPRTIVSDRDTKFTSKLWQQVMTIMGTKHNLSSAFRPQTDGQTERTNRFVQDYLRGVVNPSQNDWDDYLHLAEFAYNRRVHSSIGMSPFEADLGYTPCMPDDVAMDPEFRELSKSAKEFVLKQEAMLKIAQDAISEAQDRMKSYYDKNRLVQDFEVGDYVLLDGKNLDIRHKGFAQSKKLAPRFIGPYQIVKKVHKDSYELALSRELKLHPVFHTSLLKPYGKDESRQQKIQKVLLADGSEGQLVKAILNHRKRYGKMQYKIWWLGETKNQSTWEPLENLKQIPGLIEQYWSRKKGGVFLKGGQVTDASA
ncbi:Retrovirus polyprotein, partial [Globisporangium splendens]